MLIGFGGTTDHNFEIIGTSFLSRKEFGHQRGSNSRLSDSGQGTESLGHGHPVGLSSHSTVSYPYSQLVMFCFCNAMLSGWSTKILVAPHSVSSPVPHEMDVV